MNRKRMIRFFHLSIVVLIFLCAIAVLNFNAFVFPLTLFERHVGSWVSSMLHPSQSPVGCNSQVAAHRGFANINMYQDSSRTAIEAAIQSKVRAIEIDVNIVSNNIYLMHDNFTLEEINNPKLILLHHPQILTLQEFLNLYSRSFDVIIVDIKEVNVAREAAFDLFKQLSFLDDKEKFNVIGLSCRLIRQIERELNIKSGCESQGVIANWALGLSLWSTNFRTTNEFQVWINKILKLKTIIWTFDTASEAKDYCQYKPDSVLVDFVFR